MPELFPIIWYLTPRLLDTVETYFDSHVDLLQRKLQKHSDRLKLKAEETFKMREISGDLLAENLEREIKNMKMKVSHTTRYVYSPISLNILFSYQGA